MGNMFTIPDGIFTVVDLDDIARVAAEALDKLNFKGHSHVYVISDLSGTDEIASLIGKEVKFPAEDFKKVLLNYGFADGAANDYVEMFATLDTGLLFGDIRKTRPKIEGTSIEESLRKPGRPGTAETGLEFLKRKHLRQVDRDPEVNEKVGELQIEAIVKWGVLREGSYDYLKTIKQPTLIVNGNKDLIIYRVNSFILQQNIPNAQLILYPDSNHRSLCDAVFEDRPSSAVCLNGAATPTNQGRSFVMSSSLQDLTARRSAHRADTSAVHHAARYKAVGHRCDAHNHAPHRRRRWRHLRGRMAIRQGARWRQRLVVNTPRWQHPRPRPKADLAWSDANVRIGWSGPQLSGCSSSAPPDFIGR